jgi:hypothetical protein
MVFIEGSPGTSVRPIVARKVSSGAIRCVLVDTYRSVGQGLTESIKRCRARFLNPEIRWWVSFEIAVMNNQAKRPYSNTSTSQYSIGFLARSTLDLFITAVPVTVPYIARDNGISERAKHKSGWFRMLSCPMPVMLSRRGL